MGRFADKSRHLETGIIDVSDFLNIELHRDQDRFFRRGFGNCEHCGRKLTRDHKKIFISIMVYGKKPDGSVLITCNRCNSPAYDIQLSRFIGNGEGAIEWLSHLCEKTWLSNDVTLRFFKTMCKLRDFLQTNQAG